MPKPTFRGVKLQLIGDTSITVQYPDVHSIETFVKLKEACDAVAHPKLDIGAVPVPKAKD